MALLAMALLAGCIEAPKANPIPGWCPPEPFHLDGPVVVKVGYGQVWVSNGTGVYRFTVPADTPDARAFCSEVEQTGGGPQ